MVYLVIRIKGDKTKINELKEFIDYFDFHDAERSVYDPKYLLVSGIIARFYSVPQPNDQPLKGEVINRSLLNAFPSNARYFNFNFLSCIGLLTIHSVNNIQDNPEEEEEQRAIFELFMNKQKTLVLRRYRSTSQQALPNGAQQSSVSEHEFLEKYRFQTCPSLGENETDVLNAICFYSKNPFILATFLEAGAPITSSSASITSSRCTKLSPFDYLSIVSHDQKQEELCLQLLLKFYPFPFWTLNESPLLSYLKRDKVHLAEMLIDDCFLYIRQKKQSIFQCANGAEREARKRQVAQEFSRLFYSLFTQTRAESNQGETAFRLAAWHLPLTEKLIKLFDEIKVMLDAPVTLFGHPTEGPYSTVPTFLEFILSYENRLRYNPEIYSPENATQYLETILKRQPPLAPGTNRERVMDHYSNYRLAGVTTSRLLITAYLLGRHAHPHLWPLLVQAGAPLSHPKSTSFLIHYFQNQNGPNFLNHWQTVASKLKATDLTTYPPSSNHTMATINLFLQTIDQLTYETFQQKQALITQAFSTLVKLQLEYNAQNNIPSFVWHEILIDLIRLPCLRQLAHCIPQDIWKEMVFTATPNGAKGPHFLIHTAKSIFSLKSNEQKWREAVNASLVEFLEEQDAQALIRNESFLHILFSHATASAYARATLTYLEKHQWLDLLELQIKGQTAWNCLEEKLHNPLRLTSARQEFLNVVQPYVPAGSPLQSRLRDPNSTKAADSDEDGSTEEAPFDDEHTEILIQELSEQQETLLFRLQTSFRMEPEAMEQTPLSQQKGVKRPRKDGKEGVNKALRSGDSLG